MHLLYHLCAIPIGAAATASPRSWLPADMHASVIFWRLGQSLCDYTMHLVDLFLCRLIVFIDVFLQDNRFHRVILGRAARRRRCPRRRRCHCAAPPPPPATARRQARQDRSSKPPASRSHFKRQGYRNYA
eukprot:4773842-Pleurochrysis_carterae.AAC.1